MEIKLDAGDMAKCFSAKANSTLNEKWVSELINRICDMFADDIRKGFDIQPMWVAAYALHMFRRVEQSTNVIALACFVIAMKMLDDDAEENASEYTKQMSTLSTKDLVEAELYVFRQLNFNAHYSSSRVKETLRDAASKAGVTI